MKPELRERKLKEALETPGEYQYRALTRGHPVQRFWHRSKLGLLEWFFRPEPGERVLDVGCGSGVFADRLAALGAEVLAVDTNPEAVRWAGEHFERNGLRFRLGTIEELDLSPASFDHAVCLEVIEHLGDEETRSLLRSVRSVLRPEGSLLLTTPNYRGLWPLVEWGADRFSEAAHMGGVQHVTRYHRRRLRRLLEDSGYRVEELRTFSTFAPFVAALSEGLAMRIERLERRIDLPFGNLLVARARRPGP